MFNEKLKNEFKNYKLQHATYDPYYIDNVFNKTEPFETELNKDVCNFSSLEIENMYKTLNFMSSNTLMMFNSLLLSYTGYCFMNGHVKDSQNHFEEFDAERMNTLVNKFVLQSKIIKRKTIEDWCNELPNPSDRFLLLGLFEGISGNDYIEFSELEKKDINVENCEIDLPERGKAKFSRQLCNYGIDSAEENIYTSLTVKSKEVKLVESEYIIKRWGNVQEGASQFRKGRRIYSRIRRIFKYLGVDSYLKPGDIANSGVIDWLNRKGKESGIGAKKYLFDNLQDVKKRFNRNIQASRFYGQFKDFLE